MLKSERLLIARKLRSKHVAPYVFSPGQSESRWIWLNPALQCAAIYP